MPYFPQLLSGAGTQFPAIKNSVRRTIVNSCLDGSTVKLADPAAATVEWHLELRGLTDEEWNSIESLYQGVEGRLGSFTFLDPTDNLLAWSEDLGAGAWLRDAPLELTANISDPLETTRATRITNASQSAAVIEQTLSIPSWYHYCFSVYVRSDQATDIYVYRRSSSAEDRKPFSIGPTWRRVEHSAKLAGSDESVSFGIELQGGQVLEVFGLQLEAQIGASPYKKTLSRNGVYDAATFQDDSLAVTTEGLDQHSCVLRIRVQAQD